MFICCNMDHKSRGDSRSTHSHSLPGLETDPTLNHRFPNLVRCCGNRVILMDWVDRLDFSQLYWPDWLGWRNLLENWNIFLFRQSICVWPCLWTLSKEIKSGQRRFIQSIWSLNKLSGLDYRSWCCKQHSFMPYGLIITYRISTQACQQDVHWFV